MEHYVGLDVSLKRTSICVVDHAGNVFSEGTVNSEPEAIARSVIVRVPEVRGVGEDHRAVTHVPERRVVATAGVPEADPPTGDLHGHDLERGHVPLRSLAEVLDDPG